MDERQLQMFLTVADRQSFTRAAEVLHTSQPTISLQVKALEAEVGARLVDRTNKTVALTPAGQALYKHAARLLRDLGEMRRAVILAAGEVVGRLTVGATLTIGDYILPPVVAEFQRHFPAVSVCLHTQNTGQIIRLLMAGELDLALVEGPVAAGEIELNAFLEDELLLIAPADYRWLTQPVVELHELPLQNWVVREPASGTRSIIERHLESAGLRLADFRIVSELSTTEAIKGAVEAGLGVTVLSQWAIRKELLLGTLIARRIRHLPMRRQLAIATLRGRTLVPAAAALIQQLQGLAPLRLPSSLPLPG